MPGLLGHNSHAQLRKEGAFRATTNIRNPVTGFQLLYIPHDPLEFFLSAVVDKNFSALTQRGANCRLPVLELPKIETNLGSLQNCCQHNWPCGSTKEVDLQVQQLNKAIPAICILTFWPKISRNPVASNYPPSQSARLLLPLFFHSFISVVATLSLGNGISTTTWA